MQFDRVKKQRPRLNFPPPPGDQYFKPMTGKTLDQAWPISP